MVVVKSKEAASKKADTTAKKNENVKAPVRKETKKEAEEKKKEAEAKKKAEEKKKEEEAKREQEAKKEEEAEAAAEVEEEDEVEEVNDENVDEEEQEAPVESEDVAEEVAEGEEEAGGDVEEVEEDVVEDENEEDAAEEDGDAEEEDVAGGEEKEADEEEEDVDDDFDVEEELKRKVKLDDGTEARIYSRGPKYANGLWPINCHLCRFGSILQNDRLKKHIRSRKHARKLKKDVFRAQDFNVCYYQQGSTKFGLDTPIKIYPGEFIEEIGEKYKDRILTDADELPGDAEDGKISARTQSRINQEKIHSYNKNAPIMGLCYAIKILGRNSQYYCGLCRIKIFGEAYQHFVGANHQAKYIIKHFPRLYEKVVEGLASVKNTSLQTKYVRNIFRKLYRKIENMKGRRTVTFCTSNSFNNFHRKHINRLNSVHHYDENTITISDSELESLIKKSINGVPFIKPDLISIEKPDTGLRDDGLPSVGGSSSSSGSSRRNRKRERERSPPPRSRREVPPAPTRSRRDAPAPPPAPTSSEPSAKSRRKERFNDDPQDWQRYRSMIGTVLDELDKVYEEYEKTPESHPEYNQEWRTYWRRRCKELERDNIDPRYYDFNKEWIPYWLRRLRELHAKDIVRRKFEMKRTLRLSYDTRSPSPIRQRRKPRRSPSPPPARNSSNRYRDGDRSVGNIMEDVALAPSEPLSVISVMRLLTALEDQLGSLGPKAVQLLSRAVLFEKNNQNPNELLLENDFHVFFMTAKEKLKGQLLANLVEPHKIPAVKNAVNDLTTILRMFEEHMGRQGSNQRGGMGSGGGSSNQFGNFSGNDGGNQYNDRNYNGNNQLDLASRNNYGNNGGGGGGVGRSQNIPTNYGSNQGGIWQRGDGNLSSNNYRDTMGGGSGGGGGGVSGSGGGGLQSSGNFASSFSGVNRSGMNSGGGNAGSFDYNSNNSRASLMNMDMSRNTSRNLPSLTGSSLGGKFGFNDNGNNRGNFGMNRTSDFGRSTGRY